MENISNINNAQMSEKTYPVHKTVSIKNVQADEKQSKDTEAVSKNSLIEPKDMEKQISEAIDKVNADERFRRTGCEFEYHKESKRVSITVYDQKTKEVIREIPPEDTMEMLDNLNQLAGLLLDEKK